MLITAIILSIFMAMIISLCCSKNLLAAVFTASFVIITPGNKGLAASLQGTFHVNMTSFQQTKRGQNC